MATTVKKKNNSSAPTEAVVGELNLADGPLLVLTSEAEIMLTIAKECRGAPPKVLLGAAKRIVAALSAYDDATGVVTLPTVVRPAPVKNGTKNGAEHGNGAAAVAKEPEASAQKLWHGKPVMTEEQRRKKATEQQREYRLKKPHVDAVKALNKKADTTGKSVAQLKAMLKVLQTSGSKKPKTAKTASA